MPQVNRNSSTSGAHTSRMVRWKGERVMSMTRMMAARPTTITPTAQTMQANQVLGPGTVPYMTRHRIQLI